MVSISAKPFGTNRLPVATSVRSRARCAASALTSSCPGAGGLVSATGCVAPAGDAGDVFVIAGAGAGSAGPGVAIVGADGRAPICDLATGRLGPATDFDVADAPAPA